MGLSKDLKKEKIKEKMGRALQSENQEEFIQAYIELADSIKEEIMEDVHAYQATADAEILQKRGVHQLTSEEKKFYEEWIKAANSSNPKQALTNLEVGLPQTVIDNVMQDMKTKHPLLDAINFVPATALTKILVNKQGKQLAHWGKITSAITKELEGTIGAIDLSLCKLTAFLPVYKDMLAIGETWIDAYVRATLEEAVSFALEDGIINGNGVEQPIGMIRNISDGVDMNTKTGYPEKEAIAITDLSPTTYGSLLAELAKDPNDDTKERNVDNIILVCNPFDYFTTIMPATTYLTPQGAYVNDILPFPTTIIQSCQMGRGKAILGAAKQYAMGLGTGSAKGGKIEYSDEYKFLEDQRYYITKLIANGTAMNNNDFILIDISKLKPMRLKVDNTVDTLKTLTITSVAGTEVGDTKITVSPAVDEGNSYKYKVGDNISSLVVNQLALSGWTSWDGAADITAATGKKIVVVEVNGIGQVKGVGSQTVTAKE